MPADQARRYDGAGRDNVGIASTKSTPTARDGEAGDPVNRWAD